MVAQLFHPGTFYKCGCWHGGDPKDHPEICQTHKKEWSMRYHPTRIERNEK